MKKLLKLINGDIVFGEIEAVEAKSGQTEILIKNPWTSHNGNISPYMMIEMGQAVPAVQIHPMNILWSAPLEDFEEANKVYIEKTTGIVVNPKEKIII